MIIKIPPNDRKPTKENLAEVIEFPSAVKELTKEDFLEEIRKLVERPKSNRTTRSSRRRKIDQAQIQNQIEFLEKKFLAKPARFGRVNPEALCLSIAIAESRHGPMRDFDVRVYQVLVNLRFAKQNQTIIKLLDLAVYVGKSWATVQRSIKRLIKIGLVASKKTKRVSVYYFPILSGIEFSI